MLLRELYEQSEQPTVMVFKGMHGDGFPGNQQCIELAKKLKADAFEYTQRADALRRIKERTPKKLVLIGYSAGAKTVMDIAQQHRPALTILIAAYPTVLQAHESKIPGEYVNYYQQKELDSILRSRGLPAYKPQGGKPIQVDKPHGEIVSAVTPDIISRVKNL